MTSEQRCQKCGARCTPTNVFLVCDVDGYAHDWQTPAEPSSQPERERESPQERISEERLSDEALMNVERCQIPDCGSCAELAPRLARELQQRREADRLLVEVELTAMERRCGALPEGR